MSNWIRNWDSLLSSKDRSCRDLHHHDVLSTEDNNFTSCIGYCIGFVYQKFMETKFVQYSLSNLVLRWEKNISRCGLTFRFFRLAFATTPVAKHTTSKTRHILSLKNFKMKCFILGNGKLINVSKGHMSLYCKCSLSVSINSMALIIDYHDPNWHAKPLTVNYKGHENTRDLNFENKKGRRVFYSISTPFSIPYRPLFWST
jgi:hypothetical protein